MARMSVEQFLHHSTRNRKKFVKKWESTPPFAINTWLHTRASIMSVWRHPWLRINVSEDRVTKVMKREVWGDQLVCYEDEETLNEQRFIDKDTGIRETPPKLCPHCIMIEYVRAEVRAGRMSWTQPLFRFDDGDPRKTRMFLAAGLYGGFKDKKVTGEQLKELANIPMDRGGPVFVNEAYKYESLAKLAYVFCVVDNEDVAAGTAIATTSQSLGEKVQKLITDTMKGSRVPEHGNPQVNPYCIRWEKNPTKGINPNDVYSAMRWDHATLTPAINELIRNTEPPDTTSLGERFNLETHRATLERFALVQLPWDSFFANARAEADARKRTPEVGTPSAPVPANVTAPYPGALPGMAPPVAVVLPTPTGPVAVEQFACDNAPQCDAVLLATDPRCPKCGKQYEVVGAPVQAQPPVAPATFGAAMNVPQPMTVPNLPVTSEADPYGGDPSDDIPF